MLSSSHLQLSEKSLGTIKLNRKSNSEQSAVSKQKYALSDKNLLSEDYTNSI